MIDWFSIGFLYSGFFIGDRLVLTGGCIGFFRQEACVVPCLLFRIGWSPQEAGFVTDYWGQAGLTRGCMVLSEIVIRDRLISAGGCFARFVIRDRLVLAVIQNRLVLAVIRNRLVLAVIRNRLFLAVIRNRLVLAVIRNRLFLAVIRNRLVFGRRCLDLRLRFIRLGWLHVHPVYSWDCYCWRSGYLTSSGCDCFRPSLSRPMYWFDTFCSLLFIYSQPRVVKWFVYCYELF